MQAVLQSVLQRIAVASQRATRPLPVPSQRWKKTIPFTCTGRQAWETSADSPPRRQVRLVAVSKTKPVEALREAYDAGQRVFGENYVQELLDKAPQMPADVAWHFIGHLQTNKAGPPFRAPCAPTRLRASPQQRGARSWLRPQAKALVAGVPGLRCVETVDSEKLASLLDKAWQARRAPLRPPPLRHLPSPRAAGSVRLPTRRRPCGQASSSAGSRRLDIFVQVNTSGEETKHGVEPPQALGLARHVADKCPHLRFAGLMTIGAPQALPAAPGALPARQLG